MFYTICNSCQRAQGIARENERYAKAVKLEDWDGWVYVEGVGFQDGFFRDTDELKDHCLEDGEDVPTYAWTCSSKPLVQVDADDILDDIFKDSNEDYERRCISGISEFRDAVKAFNEANKHLLTYDPDYKTLVLLNK